MIPAKFMRTCLPIILLRAGDRIAFITFTRTLRNFMLFFDRPNTMSSVSGSLMWTLSTVATVFSSVVDAYLGRFGCLTVFGAISISGCMGAIVSTYPSIASLNLCMASMFAIATLGSGGLRMVDTFGAEQFDPETEADEQRRFFSWQFSICYTLEISVYAFFAPLAMQGLGAIPSEYSYFASYTMVSGMFAIGYATFIAMSSGYTHYKSGTSSLWGFVHYIVTGAKHSWTSISVPFAWFVMAVTIVSVVAGSFITNQILTYINMGLVTIALMSMYMSHMYLSDYVFDVPMTGSSLTPKDAYATMRLIPVLVTTLFNQPLNSTIVSTLLPIQACQMNLPFNPEILKVVETTTTVGFMVGLDLLSNCIPAFLVDTQPRLVTGACVSLLTSISLVVIEIQRKMAPVLDRSTACAPHGAMASDMSGWYMLIPIILCGLSTALFRPTITHFTVVNCPQCTRAIIIMVQNILHNAVSNVIVTSVMSMMKEFMPDDMNDPVAHIEYIYFITISITALAIPIFVLTLRDFSKDQVVN